MSRPKYAEVVKQRDVLQERVNELEEALDTMRMEAEEAEKAETVVVDAAWAQNLSPSLQLAVRRLREFSEGGFLHHLRDAVRLVQAEERRLRRG